MPSRSTRAAGSSAASGPPSTHRVVARSPPACRGPGASSDAAASWVKRGWRMTIASCWSPARWSAASRPAGSRAPAAPAVAPPGPRGASVSSIAWATSRTVAVPSIETRTSARAPLAASSTVRLHEYEITLISEVLRSAGRAILGLLSRRARRLPPNPQALTRELSSRMSMTTDRALVAQAADKGAPGVTTAAVALGRSGPSAPSSPSAAPLRPWEVSAGQGQRLRVVDVVRPQVGLVVVAVEHRRGGAADRRDDPAPVGGAEAARLLLAPQVGEEAVGLGVVVGDGDPHPLEGVEHGDVQLHQRQVAPERPLAAGVQAHPLGDHRELVIAPGVAQVAGADLGAHVPAVERGRLVADPADLQAHVRDRRHREPAQVQPGEPVEARVAERHLVDHVGRQLVQSRRLPGGLHDQREHVEASATTGPAEPANPPAGDGLAQVGDALAGDLVGAAHPAAVAHPQAAPVQPADAAAAVAPGHARAMDQLPGRVPVGPEALDVGPHLAQPDLHRSGLRVLLVEQADEPLRLG